MEVTLRAIPVLLGSLWIVASTAAAQDPVTVDPTHYKVEFENAQVRVLRIRRGPHEKSVMHSHPNFVVVFLTDQHFKFTYPSGQSVVVSGTAGQTAWGEAGTHAVENLSDTASELIEIELKEKR